MDIDRAAVIHMQDGRGIVTGLAIFAAAALLSAVLIVVLRPLLARYAMARPNARSSHAIPTPQGGGIAVIAATIAVSGSVLLFSTAASPLPLTLVFAGVLLIAAVGVLADKHPVDVVPRLVLQTFAIVAVLFALPPGLRLLPVLPWWCERIALVIGGLWFVNLVNFMDGLDWMTVAEVIPITAALAAIGFLGILPWQDIVLSLALCGAMVGFAFFNRPIATLFLGDVGSLPIGLLLGWLLLLLAGSGARTAAILLPLYYLADSTITLIRRAAKGEPVSEAHRSHFYQRATDRGFSVTAVVSRVFVVNLGLCSLALVTVLFPGWFIATSALIVGAGLVAGLIVTFARGKKNDSSS
jgi:UDP-N-acetylmuramyl pentapeptide phosphotransferase/UDP-N-acetylglucosamine-1-phosphate transferase